MTSRPVRICFCRKRSRPWSEFRIHSNQYSIRSFQRVLVGFNNLWMHSIFILFNCVSWSKMFTRPFQIEIWARCLEVAFFPVPEEIVYSFLNFLFDIFWNSINLNSIELYKGFCLRLSFYLLPLKESLTLFHIRIFCYTFTFFVLFGVVECTVTKINFKYFNGNCDYCSCPAWPILVLFAPAHKGLAFWNNYHRVRLPLR